MGRAFGARAGRAYAGRTSGEVPPPFGLTLTSAPVGKAVARSSSDHPPSGPMSTTGWPSSGGAPPLSASAAPGNAATVAKSTTSPTVGRWVRRHCIAASRATRRSRSSGAQIQVATRSGTQDFHGGGYWFKRHEGWNANSFTNNQKGTPIQIYRFLTAGYDIGGPIYIPGKLNSDKQKLFFFMSHEWGRQRTPPAPRRITVPTALERAGDFSQTRDGAGVPVIIKDPVTGQPFPGNRIPQDRFSPYGPQILNWLPTPNVFGNPQYNYESQVASELPSFDQVYRVDYNINDKWRAYVRVIRSDQTQNNPYGRADSGNNLALTPFYAPTFGWSVSGNIITIINPTLTNEFQFGKAKNGIPGNAPPAGIPYYRSVSNITIPLLYPNADPSGLIPNFGFGGLPLGTATTTQVTSFAGLPYANKNPITNVTDNIVKVRSTHTIKAGMFVEYSVKQENPFRPYNATILFDRDPLNLGDTGWPFSNALLGNFQQYQQFSKTVLPTAPYWNTEWYGQDTWKMTPKLTLNYGLRVNVVTPALFSAAIFDSAVPSPPLMMAPAWPILRPGGAVRPAMKATTGFFTFALIYAAWAVASRRGV